jgi:hypothetical protein
MAVVHERWLQRVNTTETAGSIAVTTANDAGAPLFCWPNRQMMIEQRVAHARTCACVELRRRDRLKKIQAGVRPANGITKGGIHDESNPT